MFAPIKVISITVKEKRNNPQSFETYLQLNNLPLTLQVSGLMALENLNMCWCGI